ncbi:MAG TPA: hypothetical protein VND99_04095 [Candidatus Acidoferrales bacterium]|nr:hypothetical protein [Candidatus Acidoferrales bacterium]
MAGKEGYTQPFTVNNLKQFIPSLYISPESRIPYVWDAREIERRGFSGGLLDQHIRHFDRNWKVEGLPPDWFRLQSKTGRHIGFSMNSQMDLLGNVTNSEVATWIPKTVQDLRGFKLEYLTDHIVYPCKYERSSSDPTRLENRHYGYTDIIDTVSADERGGSVRRSLQEMKAFFLDDDTPDGSIAVMVSPRGETGLRTDDGKLIQYPDSYFFFMVKEGDTVHNFTLKTDFSIAECRDVIARLTGVTLPVDAPLEQYVRTIAKIKPGGHDATPDVTEIVGVLEQVRPEYAFTSEGRNEKITWRDVYQDIRQRDQLYEFSEKTNMIINEFEAYCLQGNHTKLEYQKALAATILRMSKVFFLEENYPEGAVPLVSNQWSTVRPPLATYGDVLTATTKRPGCSGGGSGESLFVKSPDGVRRGETDWFTCPKCHYKADGPIGDTCPKCKITKQEYAESGGKAC